MTTFADVFSWHDLRGTAYIYICSSEKVS